MGSFIASTIYHPERSTPLTRRLRDHTIKRRRNETFISKDVAYREGAFYE